MALASYTDLKAEIADFANRTDLTSQIVDFIALAEARMYDDMVLKDMESDEALTLTAAQNYVALPAGFISPIAFWLVVNAARLLLTPELPAEMPYDAYAGVPRRWAIDGPNIRFDRPSDANYTAYLRCLKKSNLSGSVASNYILAQRPDIYLAASLVELARYTRDADLFTTWEPKYLSASKAFKARDSRNHSIVPLRTELGVRRRSNVFTGV